MSRQRTGWILGIVMGLIGAPAMFLIAGVVFLALFAETLEDAAPLVGLVVALIAAGTFGTLTLLGFRRAIGDDAFPSTPAELRGKSWLWGIMGGIGGAFVTLIAGLIVTLICAAMVGGERSIPPVEVVYVVGAISTLLFIPIVGTLALILLKRKVAGEILQSEPICAAA